VAAILKADLDGTALVLEAFGNVIASGGSGMGHLQRAGITPRIRSTSCTSARCRSDTRRCGRPWAARAGRGDMLQEHVLNRSRDACEFRQSLQNRQSGGNTGRALRTDALTSLVPGWEYSPSRVEKLPFGSAANGSCQSIQLGASGTSLASGQSPSSTVVRIRPQVPRRTPALNVKRTAAPGGLTGDGGWQDITTVRPYRIGRHADVS
jgi:hypothetical protein